MKADNKIPTEEIEQAALFEWAEWMKSEYPELALMYHIPNGGSRHKAEAAKLKRQGVRPGVPDICLPVPRGRYHGLYIEMKRVEGGRVSKDQKLWLTALAGQGYKCYVCFGCEDAKKVIVEYLGMGG